jgi:hypothetical protein
VKTLRPLLLLEFLLLAGWLAVGVIAGPSLDPNAAGSILAGLLAVSAMAVQNALGSLSGAPPTAAMTRNVTSLTLAVPAALALLAIAVACGAPRRERSAQLASAPPPVSGTSR